MAKRALWRSLAAAWVLVCGAAVGEELRGEVVAIDGGTVHLRQGFAVRAVEVTEQTRLGERRLRADDLATGQQVSAIVRWDGARAVATSIAVDCAAPEPGPGPSAPFDVGDVGATYPSTVPDDPPGPAAPLPSADALR
jgi:hypothetical protein